jgi:hypothetical protein
MTSDVRNYPMHKARRCGAMTRLGATCLSPAMRNGRCRMHGGKSLSGTLHGRFRHGDYTQAAIAERRAITALIKQLGEAPIVPRRFRAEALCKKMGSAKDAGPSVLD